MNAIIETLKARLNTGPLLTCMEHDALEAALYYLNRIESRARILESCNQRGDFKSSDAIMAEAGEARAIVLGLFKTTP